ncbi:hypothetical protein B1F79_05375 [Coxiella-like endosymbiont of Rhipicephalus sanguineus]|uniref:hypothetical protein n=1 Tax=Coxiella-like endosymbiont of Rhipicephalus sanguineus TaxID=1955402 RepID=UPI00203C6CE3|nr:hypothetical protein [Coxiella-like endosymbiont of Rhipicephalus sanguineus]MBT8506810.1 hypothetical protein [Coxiella-like endosymbiont of Rhipicephalus sanguineus]
MELFFLKKAFDIYTTKQLTLKEAQDLITDIAVAMTADDFLRSIDGMIGLISKNASILEKRKALLNILLPLHLSVIEKHDLYGEQGYVQAQKSIDGLYSIMILLLWNR